MCVVRSSRQLRSKLRKALRVVVWTSLGAVALIVALLVALALYARSEAGHEALRALLVSQLQSVLPGFSVGALRGDYVHGLALEHVVLRDRFGGEAIRIDAVRLDYDLSAALRRTLRVRRVSLERPHVVLRTAANGQANLAELIKPSEEPPSPSASAPPAWNVALEQLRIERGAFADQRRAAGLAITALDLRGAADLRGKGARLRLERWCAQVRLPDGRRLDAHLSGRVDLRDGSRIAGQLSIKAKELTPAAGKPEVARRSRAAALALGLGGTVERPELSARANFDQAGAIRATGWLAPRAAPLRYGFAVELDGLEPHLLAEGLPETRLNARVEVEGHGIPPDAQSSSALKVDLGRSRVAGFAVRSLSLIGQTRGASWTVEKLQARARRATLRARGRGTLEELNAQVELIADDLSRLAAAPGRGSAPLGLRGSMRLEAAVEGRLDDLALRAKGSAERLGSDKGAVRALRLQADLAGLPRTPRGQLTVTADDVRLVEPALEVESFSAAFRGGLRRASIDLAARGRRLALSLAAQLKRPTDESLHVLVKALRGRYEDSALELQRPVLARYLDTSNRAGLTIEPLDLRLALGSAHARLRARGAVPLARGPGSSLRLSTVRPIQAQVKLDDLPLELLGRFGLVGQELGGRVSLDAKLDGALRAPKLQLVGLLERGRVARIDRLAAQLDCAIDERVQLRGAVERAGRRVLAVQASFAQGLAGLLQLSALRQNETPLSARVQAGPIDLHELELIEPSLTQFRGQAHAGLTLSGTPARPRVALDLTLEGARVERRDLGDLRLEGGAEAEPTRVRGRVALKRGKLTLALGQAALAGGWHELLGAGRDQVPIDARLSVPKLPVKRLRRYEDALSRLAGGTLAADATLAGTLGDPSANVVARLDRIALETGVLGSARVEGRYAAKRVEGRMAILQGERGGELSLEGRLKLAPRPELKAALGIKGLRIAFVSALAPGLEQSDGLLSGRVSLVGPVARPRLDADLRLAKGRLRLRGMSELRDIELHTTLEHDVVRLHRLSVNSGPGRLSATGELKLEQLEPERFALRAEAKRFQLGVPPIARATLDGAIALRGSQRRQKLDVAIDLRDGVLRVPKIDAQRELHASGALPDVVFDDRVARAERRRAEKKQAKRAGRARRIAVRAKTDSLMVRGEQIDVEVESDLRIEPGPRGARINGQLQIRRGTVEILGNRYEVERALVRFSGERPPDPVVDIRLRRDFPEATVYIALRGTMEDNELQLSSDPGGYDQSQLLSLITLGRVDPRAGESGGDRSQAVASAVSQAVLGLLAQQVATRVGLDVARVGIGQTQDQTTGEARIRAEAEIGKYITRRLYIAYRRVFGGQDTENANEALSEYRISSRWLLMALFGDRGVGNLDLVWTYRY